MFDFFGEAILLALTWAVVAQKNHRRGLAEAAAVGAIH